ncbi:MAG: secondary thiamine-phosphate synthase enzyme YjbQ [Verrucomicrobiota bacterium]|nr:secondary thiamine-phosphate synthase enzyme YjbQ [Verrucomicrobiota bacterium]
MGVFKKNWSLRTKGKGTYEITDSVNDALRESGLQEGLISVFVQHTSCSLILMENADPTARVDLERFMDDLVPEDYPYFVHTIEGPDDMPSHIKMTLTRSTENLPFSKGKLDLGTWQGIFLWEHRISPHNRKLVITALGE